MATPSSTNPATLGQDLKAWAADQLQVEPGAPPGQVRAAFLRQVQTENGTVDLAAREALLILVGRPNAARPGLALEAAELALDRAVDEFASRFFALGIAERKVVWEGLKARGQGFVRVDARLAALRPGLYLVLPPLDRHSPAGQLVSAIRKLFVLRPADRAAARQAWLNEADSLRQWQAWVEAARQLRRDHPATAELEPELMSRLADAQVVAEQKAKLNHRMRQAARAETAGAAKQGNSRWWAWSVAVACLTCARLACTGPFSSRPEVPPNERRDVNFDLKDLDRFRRERVILDPDGKQAPGDAERLFGKDFLERLRAGKDKQKGP
jgi:hypothetical protein